jgi:exodeoxyribonuclease VII small subunit
MSEHPEIQKLTYEQAFAELEAIVAALESNQSSLAQATSLYERGQLLAEHCTSLLDQAALKISQLSGESPADSTPEG